MAVDFPNSLRLRPSAKAVIIRDGAVLLTRNFTDPAEGDWFVLPGGGQRPGETLHEALHREVAEETGLAVDIHELLWVREFVAATRSHSPAVAKQDHAVEFMFRCSHVAGDPVNADGADDHQIGVEWVLLPAVAGLPFYPRALRSRLAGFAPGSDPGPVYVGDVE